MIHRGTRNVASGWKVLILSVALLAAGCSETPARYSESSPALNTPLGSAGAVSGSEAAALRTPEPTGVNYFGSLGDEQRLEQLWKERTETKASSDFPIGPGDEIVIVLPAVKELNKATVKVSATGDISLPLIGKIHASGLTEPQLREELRRRLLKYMYDPQFQLSVKQYLSRQVAVLGEVGRPGVLTLSSASETVLEAIGRAGGPTRTAADRVILIPASATQTAPNPQTMAAAVEMVSPGGKARTAPEEQAFGEADGPVQTIGGAGGWSRSPLMEFSGVNGRPLVMMLHSDSNTGTARFLNMPLRPGDVLVVPSAGRVAVIGWVHKPGSFAITSGFTALSAIGAAGGPMFAADQTHIHLIRVTNAGNTETISLNLDRIMRGQEPDVPLQGNDVIDVGYSTAKVIPYAFYSVFNSKVWFPMPF